MSTVSKFAISAHGKQKYGSLPYAAHLQSVVNVLLRFGAELSDPIIDAAWLHDALEDTTVTREEIQAKFGAVVASLVYAVTDEPGANRKERKLRTYPKIRACGSDAVRLKVADRIANTEAAADDPRSGLLKMYQREFAEFSTALYASGECERMWNYLRRISTSDTFAALTDRTEQNPEREANEKGTSL